MFSINAGTDHFTKVTAKGIPRLLSNEPKNLRPNLSLQHLITYVIWCDLNQNSNFGLAVETCTISEGTEIYEKY